MERTESRRRPLWKAVGGLGFGLGFLALAAAVHAPPEVAPAAAEPAGPLDAGWRAGVLLLGGFRPLAIDLLWLRADGLFRRGRLWELAALFRAIAALDPRNEKVREFAAWHLAYNVLLAEEDPERRFDWFVQGVRLLEGGERSGRAWRLPAFGGLMILDRQDAGVIPRFGERVRERFGAPPGDLAASWLEEAAGAGESPAYVHALLLGCLERLRREAVDRGDSAAATRLASTGRAALTRARTRFPGEDWSFAEGTG